MPAACKGLTPPEAASLPGGRYFATLLGSIPDQPFDFLIITSSGLAESFAPLAGWRTRRGLKTLVQTVEGISQNSPGADLQEKIRNYIKACWLDCGTTYVLLGGDTGIIPERRVRYFDYWVPDNLLPSDIYYSDIIDTSFASGFWGYGYNANNNFFFGELPVNCGQDDGIDQTPDVFLGRAPVSSPAQARAFVAKVLAYEQGLPPGFAENVLLMADGNFAWYTEHTDQTIANLAPWAQSHEMYNPLSGSYFTGDELLTPASALSRLDQGFNIAYHFDHGGLYSLAMARDHSSAGGGWVYRPSIDALANIGKASIVITPACGPNAFDHSSISESFLNNPDGGAVAFIGNTRVGWTSQYPQFDRFFQALYGQGLRSLGAVFSEMVLSGNDYGRYSVNLLGDPAMQVYAREPLPLQAFHPSKLEPGDSALVVQVASAGYGHDRALVCLSRRGTLLEARSTAVPGSAIFETSRLPRGFVEITVTAPDHVPYADSCFVEASPSPGSIFSGFYLNDGKPGLPDGSNGNGDSTANPGEMVALYPRLGPGVVEARLSCSDPSVALVDSVIIFLSQAEVSPLSCGSRFLVSISPSLSSSRRVWLDLAVRLAGDPDFRTFRLTLDIASDSLGVCSAVYRQAALTSSQQAVLMIDSLRLANHGDGSAAGLRMWLAAVFGASNFCRDTILVGSLGSDDVSGPFGPLTIAFPPESLANLSAVLVVEDAYGRPHNLTLECSNIPSAPYSLASSPAFESEVRLEWHHPSQDLAGFNIYRRHADSAIYLKLNQIPVAQKIYMDRDLHPMTPYLYAVSAVGANGRESPLSEEAAAAAGPVLKLGFPRQLGMGGMATRVWGSPAAGDLNGDGRQELVMGCDDGLVYVFDHQGNNLPGWPKDLGVNQYGRKIVIENSSPVLADLDGNGLLDIVMGSGPWYGDVGDGLVHAWRHDGSELPGWPQSVYGDAFAPVSVADLDGDGYPEVVASTSMGMVYVWDREGNLLPGWPVQAGSIRVMAGAALGDLDGDGAREIVIASNNSGWLRIHAYKLDGSCLPGWPRDLQGGACHVLSSPALADMDGDGSLEVVLASEKDQYGVSYVYCLKADGTHLDGWPHALAFYPTLSSPAIGDLNGDGKPEIVLASGGGALYSISHTDGPVINWCREAPHNGRCSPVIADIDGDFIPEVLVATEDGHLRSYNGATGTPTSGFPVWIEPSWSAPLVSDLDGDGNLELSAFGWGSHRLYAWELPSKDLPGAVAWGRLGRDQGRTGCLDGAAGGKFADAATASSQPATPSAFHAYSLEQCRPNPAKGRVSISYQLAQPGRVELKVYNTTGQSVRTLVSVHQPAGRHQMVWDGRDESGVRVSSGTYFYRIVSGTFRDVRKAVLID